MGLFDSLKEMLAGAPKPTPEVLTLLKAIGDDPHGDEPRLAYAAYLEQNKNPRGAYIRCEVEAHRLPEADPQRAALLAQAEELLAKHGKQWVKPLKELELEPLLMGMHVPGLWFHRGMIEEVTVDKRAAIPGKLERLLELAPALRKIVFARCSPDWGAIAAAPLMQRITALDLSDVKPSLADLQALAASPNLAQLEELVLDDKEHGAPLASMLANARHWTRLKVLRLSNCGIEEEGARVLAAASNLSGLEELDVSYNRLGDGGLAALAASPHLVRLKIFRARSNDITATGAAALATAAWRDLQELDFDSNALGAEGVQAVTHSPLCANLRTLKLSWNRCGDAGLQAILQSPLLNKLTVLEISGNDLTDQGIVALANSLKLATVCELDLSSNPLHNVQPLAQSPHLKRLQKLKLYSVELSDTAKADLKAALGAEVIEG